jgi:hypothetical protein
VTRLNGWPDAAADDIAGEPPADGRRVDESGASIQA